MIHPSRHEHARMSRFARGVWLSAAPGCCDLHLHLRVPYHQAASEALMGMDMDMLDQAFDGGAAGPIGGPVGCMVEALRL